MDVEKRRRMGGAWSVAGLKWPEWTPPDLREWLAKLKHEYVPFDPVVVIDSRMKAVWEWYPTLEWQDVPGRGGLTLSRSSLSFCMSIRDATWMPGKPGNMPPKERTAYLAKVRGHAQALIALLDGTRFSEYDFGPEIESDELSETVVRALAPWGDDDQGHIVAFWVDECGVREMPWDYPDNHLAEHLASLIDWTHDDDYFDRSIMRSSRPIEHARSRNARTIYFTRTLYERLDSIGGAIPFSLLATVANVALSLKDEGLLDEDAARKQVRRYQARLKKRQAKPPHVNKNDTEVPF